jgi:hypothetical protein
VADRDLTAEGVGPGGLNDVRCVRGSTSLAFRAGRAGWNLLKWVVEAEFGELP